VTLEEDRALLDSYRRGDRASLAAVFRMYVEDVAKTVRSGVVVVVDGKKVRLGVRMPEHDVEAIVQETFTRAFAPRARESYDGIRPFGAYLATIARNLLIDRGRREVREAKSVVAVDDVGELADPEETDPTWRLEEEALDKILDAMKQALVEPDRSIFVCRVEKQMSFKEAAAATGLSEIVIRRRDTRMRAELLDRLRQHGFLENAKVRIGTSLLSRRSK
jgi:RNA polymerase sigma-70 factor (ECF subfamily)